MDKIFSSAVSTIPWYHWMSIASVHGFDHNRGARKVWNCALANKPVGC